MLNIFELLPKIEAMLEDVKPKIPELLATLDRVSVVIAKLESVDFEQLSRDVRNVAAALAAKDVSPAQVVEALQTTVLDGHADVVSVEDAVTADAADAPEVPAAAPAGQPHP